MFALGRGLIHQMVRRDEYFVAILGLDDAGKTTFLERVKAVFNQTLLDPKRITPTIGMNIGRVDYQRMRLSFWDVGGQGDLQSLWDRYITEAHAIIFVIDGSNPDRVDEAAVAFDKVMRTGRRVRALPLLVLFNKCEEQSAEASASLLRLKSQIAECRSSSSSSSVSNGSLSLGQEEGEKGDEKEDDDAGDRAEKEEQIHDDAETGEMAIMSVSAMDGTNVERCVKWIGDAIARQYTAPA